MTIAHFYTVKQYNTKIYEIKTWDCAKNNYYIVTFIRFI